MASGIIRNPNNINDNTAFDKVINLLFTREYKNVSESGEVTYEYKHFCIRSDYDAIFSEDGKTVSFEKCRQKPTITIRYNQASDNTVIDCEISVTNFNYFEDATSSGYTFGVAKAPIKYIRAQIGYFNQFPNFTLNSVPYAGGGDPINGSPVAGLTYYDYTHLINKSGGDIKDIEFEVLAAYPIKLPPDGITVFKCSVGNIFAQEVPLDPVDLKYEDFTYTNFVDDTTKYPTFAEKVFYWMITKRFSRYTSTYLQNTSDYDTETKLFSHAYAEEKGIKCELTEAVKALELPKLLTKDGKEADIGDKIYLAHKPTVLQAFNYIKENVFPEINYGQKTDGNFVVWVGSNNDIVEGLNIPSKEIIEIPAVNAINFSPLITITCPFFPKLDTFSRFSFKSRYVASNISGYFVRDELQNQDLFSIMVPVNIQVEFSTNEDKNSCSLVGLQSL